MKNRPHVVVVGGGMGGLAAAMDLSTSPCDVTLIEKDPVVGGRMHEVHLDTHRIDSGPTVFTMRWVFESLFSDAGHTLEQHLTLKPANVLARHSWIDSPSLDLFSDVEASAEAISSFAGSKEADGYLRFARESAEVFNTLELSFMQSAKPSMMGLTADLVKRNGPAGLINLWRTRPFMSLWSNLSRYFKDERLRQLFGRYATYCGSSPFSAPATLMLIAHAERTGVWFVEGGMQRLADAMQGACQANHVEVKLNTKVQQIEQKDKRVQSILLESGERISCDAVIFNGDAAALSDGLLGNSLSNVITDRRKETKSLSAITVSAYGATSGFDLSHHTVFFGNDYQDEFASIFDRQSITEQPTVYICAQDRGEKQPHTNSDERFFFLINAPARQFGDQESAEASEKMFHFLNLHGLNINLKQSVLTTPVDFAQRFPGSQGSIYGWPTHGMTGSFKRGDSMTKLAGLFLAGGSVHPGPGIPMAATSGRLAADKVRQFCGIPV